MEVHRWKLCVPVAEGRDGFWPHLHLTLASFLRSFYYHTDRTTDWLCVDLCIHNLRSYLQQCLYLHLNNSQFKCLEQVSKHTFHGDCCVYRVMLVVFCYTYIYKQFKLRLRVPYFVRSGCTGCETPGLQTKLWRQKIFSGLDSNNVYEGSKKVSFSKFGPGFGPFGLSWFKWKVDFEKFTFITKKKSNKSQFVSPSPFFKLTWRVTSWLGAWTRVKLHWQKKSF